MVAEAAVAVGVGLLCWALARWLDALLRHAEDADDDDDEEW